MPETDQSDLTRAAIRDGVRDALTVPTTIIFFTMAGFGTLATEIGFSAQEAVLTSLLMWSLPAQMVMADMYAGGAEALAILLAVSMANVRFLPMSMALMPTLAPGLRHGFWLYPLAHLMSANTWTLGMHSVERRAPPQRVAYYAPLAVVCLIAGALGTAAGYFAAATVPQPILLALILMNPIFIALLFLGSSQRHVLYAVAAGAALGPPVLSLAPDYGILVVGLVGGTIAHQLTRKRSK